MLRPTLEKQFAGAQGGITVDDILRLFGQADTGLVGSSRYDGQVMTGTLFLPLNYERFVHLIGSSTRSNGPNRMASREW